MKQDDRAEKYVVVVVDLNWFPLLNLNEYNEHSSMINFAGFAM